MERDNSLAELQWEIDGSWYGLTPAKGNPCLWAVVKLRAERGPVSTAGRQGVRTSQTRSVGVQTEGQDTPLELLGGVVTYVDDLLFAMPEVHMRPVIRLLLKKYVMKQSGCLPSRPQKKDVQIGFLGCRITRDETGTVFCDQEKYILHCMHENSFVGESHAVTLKPRYHLPNVDEKLQDEVLPEAEKRKHVTDCQRYIGQLMWLATRTRPDISAVLGICASMMVRTPKAVIQQAEESRQEEDLIHIMVILNNHHHLQQELHQSLHAEGASQPGGHPGAPSGPQAAHQAHRPTDPWTPLDRSRKSLPQLKLPSNYKSCSILDMQQMLEDWFNKSTLAIATWRGDLGNC